MAAKSNLVADFIDKVQNDSNFRDALLNKNEKELTRYFKDDFKFDPDKIAALIALNQRIEDPYKVYAFIARLEDYKN
jgi:hypothetical protein